MEPYRRRANGRAPPPQRPRRHSLGCFSSSLAAVLTIITGYSGMAAYRLKDDAATVSSATTTFCVVLVLLLLALLWLKEVGAARSAWKDRLKVVLWGLTMLLYFHIAYMAMGVVAGLTLRVALLVWFIPAAGWAGFLLYAFFRQDRVYQPRDENEEVLPL